MNILKSNFRVTNPRPRAEERTREEIETPHSRFKDIVQRREDHTIFRRQVAFTGAAVVASAAFLGVKILQGAVQPGGINLGLAAGAIGFVVGSVAMAVESEEKGLKRLGGSQFAGVLAGLICGATVTGIAGHTAVAGSLASGIGVGTLAALKGMDDFDLRRESRLRREFNQPW